MERNVREKQRVCVPSWLRREEANPRAILLRSDERDDPLMVSDGGVRLRARASLCVFFTAPHTEWGTFFFFSRSKLLCVMSKFPVPAPDHPDQQQQVRTPALFTAWLRHHRHRPRGEKKINSRSFIHRGGHFPESDAQRFTTLTL